MDRIYNIVCTVLRNVKLFINLNFCIYQDVLDDYDTGVTNKHLFD